MMYAIWCALEMQSKVKSCGGELTGFSMYYFYWVFRVCTFYFFLDFGCKLSSIDGNSSLFSFGLDVNDSGVIFTGSLIVYFYFSEIWLVLVVFYY